MIFIAIALPLGLLCIYLGCLAWSKNRLVSVALLSFSLLNLGVAFAITTLVFFFSYELGWL